MRRSSWKGRLARAAAVAGVAALALSRLATGAEVRFFRLQSAEAFLAGTPSGISVDPLGTLRLADRAERLEEVGEPFLFAGAAHPEGWVVGTGNSGKILLIDRDGGRKTLFSAPEPEVFAVLCDSDGTVWAGSSPDGKVYRIAGGEASVFFDPEETYIWALARAADGALLVATGTRGRLYKVDSTGKGEVWFDSGDTHVRSLGRLPGGDLLVGTAGEGLILRLDESGKARTLFDASHPEVVAFAATPEGGAYAAVLASEASLAEIAPAKEKPDGDEEGEDEGEADGEETPVTVRAVAEPAAAGSRPPGFRGPRSEILRLSAEGRVETVWRFEEETVYSLLWHGDRLWVGTGLEGKLYSFRDRKMVLEQDVDERQVVALLADRPGPAFATTNASAVYRLSKRRERSGTYTSPALDAGGIARFGTLRWRGVPADGARLVFAARSGMSAEPDRTWSEWAELGGGEQISLGAVPAGRYLQWRLEVEADGKGSFSISEVSVSYRQQNLPPRVNRLVVLDPGQVLVPANFNPANQLFEPAHPNRQGIFTTLRPERQPGDERLKRLWLRGYRTLRWEVEDPNEDALSAELSFRPETPGAEWMPITDRLEERYYSFDATVLPDGVYRFRLRVTDDEANRPDAGLATEEITEPVLIDHTPPALGAVEASDGKLRVEVSDRSSPLRRAEYSVDAAEWRAVAAVDGLLDGQRELLDLEVPPDARLILLRLMDAAFNSVTYDLSARSTR